MDRNELAELAKGMVPFIREYITDGLNKIIVPAELAEQVAEAVRLLHESPAVVAKSAPAQATPKIVRIERDDEGNIIPIYDGTRA